MFQVDDQLLNDLGLEALKGDDREEFKEYLKTSLQERVGERLSENIPDEVMDQFGIFMDADVEGMKAWLEANVPGYETEENFVQFRNSNPDAPESDILSSYGSLTWLRMNCPNYAEIVRATLDEIKKEIRDNRDAIVGSLS